MSFEGVSHTVKSNGSFSLAQRVGSNTHVGAQILLAVVLDHQYEMNLVARPFFAYHVSFPETHTYIHQNVTLRCTLICAWRYVVNRGKSGEACNRKLILEKNWERMERYMFEILFTGAYDLYFNVTIDN